MFKIHSINLFLTILITISLVSASSLGLVLLLPNNNNNNVNAQPEYYDNNNYYNNNDDDRYYYEEDDEYYYEEYYYLNKDKKKMKEPPMLLVKKGVLFCDDIADGTSAVCVEPDSILFPGPDSGRYVQECTSEQCEGINPSTFEIKISDNIEFPGSEEGTKLTFNGERFTVSEESINTDESSQQDIDNICKLSGFDDGGIIGSFDDSQREFMSCIIFEGDCSGIVQDNKLKECTVENYVVAIEEEEEDVKNVVITWEEVLRVNQETFAAMSMDGGATFGTAFNVSETGTLSESPQVAMSGDNAVITWRETFSGNNEIFAAMSMDGGATFGPGFNVSETGADSVFPQVAMSGDNVVITWEERFPGNRETFAAMSMDGGATFGPGFNVSDTDTDSVFPTSSNVR